MFRYFFSPRLCLTWQFRVLCFNIQHSCKFVSVLREIRCFEFSFFVSILIRVAVPVHSSLFSFIQADILKLLLDLKSCAAAHKILAELVSHHFMLSGVFLGTVWKYFSFLISLNIMPVVSPRNSPARGDPPLDHSEHDPRIRNASVGRQSQPPDEDITDSKLNGSNWIYLIMLTAGKF